MGSFELCRVQPAGGHMKPQHSFLRTRKAYCPVPQRGKGWHYTHCAHCFQPTFFITDAWKPKHHYSQNKSNLRRNLISYWYPDFTQFEEEHRKLLCAAPRCSQAGALLGAQGSITQLLAGAVFTRSLPRCALPAVCSSFK